MSTYGYTKKVTAEQYLQENYITPRLDYASQEAYLGAVVARVMHGKGLTKWAAETIGQQCEGWTHQQITELYVSLLAYCDAYGYHGECPELERRLDVWSSLQPPNHDILYTAPFMC